jgi:hypothetical protein
MRWIKVIRAGKGKKKVIAYGFPHANEIVGAETIKLLLEKINQDRRLKKFSWFLIECIDPRGAEKNREWIEKDFTLLDYINGFYRQVGSSQIDWAFPITKKQNKGMPKETRVLKEIIDREKPDFIFPLHNTSIGWAYIYLSQKINVAYYKKINMLLKKHALPTTRHKFEAGAKLFDNIYLMPTREEIIARGKIETGECGLNYARKLNKNCIGVIPDVPYFSCRLKKKHQKSLSECIVERNRGIDETVALISKWLNKLRGKLDRNSAFYDVIHKYLAANTTCTNASYSFKRIKQNSKTKILKKTKTRMDRNISGDEYVNYRILPEFVGSLFLSQFISLLNSVSGYKRSMAYAESKRLLFRKYLFVKKHLHIKKIPLRKLAMFQLDVILHTCGYTAEKPKFP